MSMAPERNPRSHDSYITYFSSIKVESPDSNLKAAKVHTRAYVFP